MIAVDTNVVDRLLVGDDPEQARRARLLFEQAPIWIGVTVLLELEWVLRIAYNFSAAAIHGAFETLLGLPQVTVGEPTVVVPALLCYGRGMDFSDALHLAAAGHGEGFASFDKALKPSANRIAGAEAITSGNFQGSPGRQKHGWTGWRRRQA